MKKRFLACVILLGWTFSAAAQNCGSSGVFVQVLGSGGPQLQDGRAASAYLVWINGKARVLVDIGGGAALRFAESGARIADLDAILFTQLDASHSAGLPALVNASRFAQRTAPLPIYGPDASRAFPSTISFVRALFDETHGAYRSLGGFLSPLGRTVYKLKPHEVTAKWDISKPVMTSSRLKVFAAPVAQDPQPTLAWRVEAGGKSAIFTGDAAEEVAPLESLASSADLLIAPAHAGANAQVAGPDTRLTPPVIARIAASAHVRRLELAQRAPHAEAEEEQTLAAVGAGYEGPVHFVNDLQCLSP